MHRQETEESGKTSYTFFQRFNLFRKFSFQMQSTFEASNNNYSNKFTDMLSQNILMHRKTPTDSCLLENIMREPESGEFIAFVWDECDFWRDSAFLMTVIMQIFT